MTGNWLGRIYAAVFSVALMYNASSAEAQERQPIELVSARVELSSIDREAGVARFLVRSGGRVRDLNRMARSLATTPGLHVDIDMIAEWNPHRIIYVCFDNIRGERPLMSRNPATVENCIGYRSARWLAAGETYLVPLQPSDAPVPSAEPSAVVTRTVRDPEDRRRITELGAEVATLADALEDAEAALLAGTDPAASAAIAPREHRSVWSVLIGMLLGIGLCFIVFFFVRRQWQEDKGRELEQLAIRIRSLAVDSKRKVEHALAGMRSKRDELVKLYGRRRLRTKFLLVHLAKHRKLLRQCLHTIQNFQRQQSEDIARRERLPKLLNLVDQARLHQIYAENARARAELVARWAKVQRSKKDESKTLWRTLVGTYRRMLADYRKEKQHHEQQVKSMAYARDQVVEDFYALTGIRSESVNPEVRIQRSVEAANKNAQALHGQIETMSDLILAQSSAQQELDARDNGIVVREREIEMAEAELVARISAHDGTMAAERATLEEEFDGRKRKHQARVALWEKEHEVKKELDAWSGGIAKAQADDVEYRMSLLEGTVRGLKMHAAESDENLRLNNDFLKEVQREYREAKELLEGIKKGPNFLEARAAQMAEYILMLEKRLGIERKSIWTGLPELPYGALPPKAKA